MSKLEKELAKAKTLEERIFLVMYYSEAPPNGLGRDLRGWCERIAKKIADALTSCESGANHA